MRLIKSHGLGNDYLVLDCGSPLDPALVQRLCDRHRGVGSDGILEPVGTETGDYGLRIWNPDGSRAEKSGNGLRIFARYLVDHRGAPCDFQIETPAGLARCQVERSSGMVTVEMGVATFDPKTVPCTVALREHPHEVEGETLRLNAVGIGNPHCVVFFPESV